MISGGVPEETNTGAETKKIAACCAAIRADMAADVVRMEGYPFDGRTLGEIHGNLAAAIDALAGMVAALSTKGPSHDRFRAR